MTPTVAKIGIGRTMISQWAGGVSLPSLTSLKKIAKATGKPLNYFADNYQEIKGPANNVTQTGDIVVSHAEMELLKKDNELLKKDVEIELIKKEIEILKLQMELLKKDKKNKNKKK